MSAPAPGADRGFGVYIHWPYCARICPYCDFNVYAAKGRGEDELLGAILQDLSGQRALSGPRRVVSVFLGGGTPSLLSGAAVARLLGGIDELWGLPAGAEVTLEANPEDAPAYADFARAGVSRLSIGVQSLDAGRLSFLGRRHSPEAGRAAILAARERFASVSADLIYATPGQDPGQWEAELTEAMALGPDHLSLYELSVEPGAAFSFAVRRGEWTPPGEDEAAGLYELTQSVCEAKGYPAYEVSNHAMRSEARSHHNTLYWRSGDWIGAGPGAHGRLTVEGGRLALVTEASPARYMRRVAEQGTGLLEPERLSRTDHARERLLMGLRLAEGLPLADLEELGARPDPDILSSLAEEGFLECGAGTVRLTLRGRLTADRVALMLSP